MHKAISAFCAGYGAVDITPQKGEFCSFRLAPNKRSLGIHDSLSAHAFLVANESESLCMMSVDTVALAGPVVDIIKERVADRIALDPAQILVAATHTHNGAELLGEEPFVDNSVQVDRVVAACVSAAVKAAEAKFSARIGWGHVELPGFAKNRFQNHVGGNIDLVDERLDFLKVENEAGEYKGIIWHFAAHPTTCMRAGFLSSADYYGAANELLAESLGGFSMFFNGACGNVNPELGTRSFERAEFHGKRIADGLLETISLTQTVNLGCLDSAQIHIEVPLTHKRHGMVLADDRDEIMDYFRQIESHRIPSTEQAYEGNWELYQRLRTSWWRHKLVEDFGDVDVETICLQAHRVLDHLILTIPGEMFVEFQLDLQTAFADNRAMIFGYANGYSGYIPDAASYEADSYETNPTFMHRAGQHAGEKMIEAGKALLVGLRK